MEFIVERLVDIVLIEGDTWVTWHVVEAGFEAVHYYLSTIRSLSASSSIVWAHQEVTNQAVQNFI